MPNEIVMLIKDIISFFQHSKGAATLLVSAGAAGGALFTYGASYLNYLKMNFRSRIVFEGVSFVERDGKVLVDFDVHGDEHELAEIIKLPILEKRIKGATRRAKDGLLRLPRSSDHRRMMELMEDWLRGSDPLGNMAKVMGRDFNDDHIAFMPTFYREEDDGAMIRVFLVDQDMLPHLRTASYCARLVPSLSRYKPRLELLKRMAEEASSAASRDGGTSVVWFSNIATARLPEAARSVRAA